MRTRTHTIKTAIFCFGLIGLTACSNLQNGSQKYYSVGHQSYAIASQGSSFQNAAYSQVANAYGNSFIQPNFAPTPYVEPMSYNKVQPYVRLGAGRLAVSQYNGRCLYPNDRAADGTRCGKRAAMLRSGGFYPY